MNSIKEISRVNELLSRWSAEVSLNNQRSDFSINTKSEYLALNILNILFDFDLINLNEIYSNYPAIDLGDSKKGIAFQVTASVNQSELKKRIKSRLESFFEKKLDLQFKNGIYFFILSDKLYNFESMNSKDYGFSGSKNILTLATIGKEIEKVYNSGDFVKFKRLLSILEREFTDNNIYEDSKVEEKPSIIIGLCLDLSKSMRFTIDTLPEKNDLSKEKWEMIMKYFLQDIVSISNMPGINTSASIFSYGYGFSNGIATAHNFLRDIGITLKNINPEEVPVKNSRDLLEIYYNKNESKIPNTPNLNNLQKNSEKYHENFKKIYFDAFKGEQSLFDCLIEIKNRLILENKKNSPQYNFLILVTNGKVEDNNYTPIINICREIEKQNVAIISFYIDKDDILTEKTLYNEESRLWEANTKGLFHCSTKVDYSNPILKKLSDALLEKNWDVPKNANLFFQLNHSKIIHDLLTSILCNKYSNE